MYVWVEGEHAYVRLSRKAPIRRPNRSDLDDRGAGQSWWSPGTSYDEHPRTLRPLKEAGVTKKVYSILDEFSCRYNYSRLYIYIYMCLYAEHVVYDCVICEMHGSQMQRYSGKQGKSGEQGSYTRRVLGKLCKVSWIVAEHSSTDNFIGKKLTYSIKFYYANSVAYCFE